MTCKFILESTVQQINSGIDLITKRANCNSLKLNVNKAQAIMVGYPRPMTKINLLTALRLRLIGNDIEYCDKVKKLDFSWTSFQDGLIRSINVHVSELLPPFTAPNALQRTFHLTSTQCSKTLVLTHFNYCDEVINNITVENSNMLQRAQNYCIQQVLVWGVLIMFHPFLPIFIYGTNGTTWVSHS